MIHTIRLPKQSTVGDVINDLKSKVTLAAFHTFSLSLSLSSLCLILEQVELSHPNAELRLLEVFYHKIYKVMDCIPINDFFRVVGKRESLITLQEIFV